MFYSDGQTDMTKLTVAFCNFANAPKKWPKWDEDILFINSIKLIPSYGTKGKYFPFRYRIMYWDINAQMSQDISHLFKTEI